MEKKEIIYNLICNADNNTYAEIIDYVFGDTIIDEIMERVDNFNEDKLDYFIKKFGNKCLLNNKNKI